MVVAAAAATFLVVFTVVVGTRVRVEVPTRVLIHQGRIIHHKAFHKVPIPTREITITEGSHILGIAIPVDITPMAMEIDTVIIRTAHIGAILEVIRTVRMVVDRVQEVDTEHMADIQTTPVTLHEVLTTATREAEEDSDEASVMWNRDKIPYVSY